MDLDARLELNTRVLRRLDPGVAQVLGVASYSVLYRFDEEWVRGDAVSAHADQDRHRRTALPVPAVRGMPVP